MEIVEEVEINGGRKVKCYDLTYGYLLDVESGKVVETKHSAIVNATELSEDEVKALRTSEVNALYDVVLRLTYPHLFDEDGKMKEIPQTDEGDEDDKKKV